jgi:hypothetical protein
VCGESLVNLVFLCNAPNIYGNLDIRIFGINSLFGVEQSLFSTSEDADMGSACFGEGLDCTGADAGSAAGDEDRFYRGR